MKCKIGCCIVRLALASVNQILPRLTQDHTFAYVTASARYLKEHLNHVCTISCVKRRLGVGITVAAGAGRAFWPRLLEFAFAFEATRYRKI
jgi:hypothetical protein